MIRAIIDANILISYLLNRSSVTSPFAVVQAAIDGAFRLLIARETVEEVRSKVATKSYLAARISSEDYDDVVSALEELAEFIPTMASPIPAVSRDRKDDYLLAQAVRAQADYLVTGDADLLVLGSHDGVEIVSPSTFVERLRLVHGDT